VVDGHLCGISLRHNVLLPPIPQNLTDPSKDLGAIRKLGIVVVQSPLDP